MVILDPKIIKRKFTGENDDPINNFYCMSKKWLLRYRLPNHDHCINELFATKKEAEIRLNFLLQEMIKIRWNKVTSMSDSEIRTILKYDENKEITNYDIACIVLAGLEGWNFTKEKILDLM